eukprot:NODE_3567_length_759_cov_35.390141_g2988_i0.p1 GENE.NODE_3567_length_759_cov_35.390141_g2988_i0~~NODE_3567_length_759_cov_35.390141_g2988_i0.p1  ORF type:complete len:75 (+),score=6.95 NODE_3567_length_759_cov_35.390141_g2988_i0:527-751(+)
MLSQGHREHSNPDLHLLIHHHHHHHHHPMASPYPTRMNQLRPTRTTTTAITTTHSGTCRFVVECYQCHFFLKGI